MLVKTSLSMTNIRERFNDLRRELSKGLEYV
jgi:hypothetical protein